MSANKETIGRYWDMRRAWEKSEKTARELVRLVGDLIIRAEAEPGDYDTLYESMAFEVDGIADFYPRDCIAFVARMISQKEKCDAARSLLDEYGDLLFDLIGKLGSGKVRIEDSRRIAEAALRGILQIVYQW